MADADDAEYRRRISAILRQHGFAWVVEQVEMQIAEGKPSSKQVTERDVAFEYPDGTPVEQTGRRRRTRLVTSEPYSESEQLEILLNGIRAALVQRADVEASVLEMLKGIDRIQFVADSVSVGAAPLSASHQIDRRRLDSTTTLRHQVERALSNMKDRDRVGT